MNTTTPIRPTAAPRSPQPLENDREFKAHIYQHLAELQPMLAPGCEVSVLINRNSGESAAAENEVALTLVATFGDYRMEVEGRDENAYTAFGIAKKKIVEQLDEFYSAAVDSTEREAEIQGLMSGALTLH